MANKLFKQAFTKDFAGISGECSSLEPDAGEVNRAVNFEYSVGNSLRGRVGCQVTAGTEGFFSIFPYRYLRTNDQYDIKYQTSSGVYPNQTGTLSTTKTVADGSSIEKMIALNTHAWVLDTMNITATYVSGSYPFTWYSYVNGSNINFNLKANGVSILDTSLGNGISGCTTIYSLLGTIDALSQLSISRTTRGTCPPFAIVNGNQTSTLIGSVGYGSRYQITVNAGHTFSAGDLICFPTASQSAGVGLIGGFVISTTGTTIDYVGVQVSLINTAVLGYMGQAATNFPISTVSTATSGNLTLSFPYWRLIFEGDSCVDNAVFKSSFTSWSTKSSTGYYAPAIGENCQGNLYIASSSTSSAGTSGYANNLLKTDGVTVVRTGLPTPIAIASSTQFTATSVLTGTYKYKAYLKRIDAQGNIVEGTPKAISETSITVTAGVSLPKITMALEYYSLQHGFQTRSCYKYTAESPASGQFFYVDDNNAAPGRNAFIQPGDPICLLDNVSQKTGLSLGALGTTLGTLHRTVCTDYDASTTPSSIKVADSSGYTIPNDSEISTGLTVVLLRTTAGGNQFYKLCEIPFNGYSAAQIIYDNCTDANLIVDTQFIDAEVGKEHDPPPPCTLVCQHQGGLVVARGPTTPNTVAFSSADNIEYFPTASNSFDVPSNQSGSITAIASDTIDRLAVFKDKAYYDVLGDLDGGTFSINVRNEGDFGISSQASLVRVNNALIGVCKNGWVTIQDGLLDPYKFRQVSARLINQNYNFKWAVAVNDYFNRQYICSIPQVSGEPVTYAIDYSRNQIITFERSYTTKIDPVGGMAMIGDTLYHLSSTSPYTIFRRLIRFDGNSPSGNGDGDSFIDNTNAINYILESQPINFGEPAQLKSPIRIRIWSLPNDYIIEGWVPFSILVETGASALAQYIGSGGTNNTSSSVTFLSETDVYKDIKLVKCKSHFYIVRFTTNTIRTAPFITGYEIMFTEEYNKEDFVK